MRPYIILKWAETKDGFIARPDYSSKWISSIESRKLVHKWRREVDAILIGPKTAILDNPSLTARLTHEGIELNSLRSPTRVVLLPRGYIPLTHNLMDGMVKTILITSYYNVPDKLPNNLSCLSINFNADSPRNVIELLRMEGINSLMIEGGAQTISSFLKLGLWDEARVFRSKTCFYQGVLAPKIDANLISTSTISDDRLFIFRPSNYSPHFFGRTSNR